MKKNKAILALALAGTMLFASACSTTGKTETTPTNAPATETTSDATTDTTAEATEETEATTDTATNKKVIRLNNSEEPGSLHPAQAQGTHDSWPIDHMFKGLFQKEQDGTIGNAVCDSYETSEDGLTWTFHLKDTKWSNGDPVLASDFAYNWFYGLNPENATKYASQLYIIKGGEAYNSGNGSVEEVGIATPDDKTLVLTLETPVPYLRDLMTTYTFYPVNEKNATANPDWYKSPDNYVSNGPFILTTWVSKQNLVLTRNTNYYNNDKTNLDELDFSMISDQATGWQLYENNQLDLVYSPLPDVIEKLRAENNTELNTNPNLATYYYNINTNKKPFNNAKVRTALSMAVNRQEIVDNITKSGQVPAYGITPVNVPDDTGADYSESLGGPLFTEDLEQAKTLLAEGLEEEGIDPATWTFSLLYNTNDTHKAIAEAIQNMWTTGLGVNCTLENADFQVCLDRRAAGDYDVARAGWIGDYVDPMTFLALFDTNNALNDSKYNNPDYDALLAKSNTQVNPTDRFATLREAEKMMIKDMPVIPIYFYTSSTVVKPNVTGVYVAINKYPNLEYADITQ